MLREDAEMRVRKFAFCWDEPRQEAFLCNKIKLQSDRVAK